MDVKDPLSQLTEEDRVFITGFLRQQKAEGNPNPLLAEDVDLDGDGITDAFGLDENGELVFVSGASLADTTYESTGGDIGAPTDG